MNKTWYWPAAVAITLAVGCASASQQSSPAHAAEANTHVRLAGTGDERNLEADVHYRDPAAERRIPLPAVAVFDALPVAYTKIGIADIAVVDTAGGVATVGVRALPVHATIGGTRLSRYLDCGSSAGPSHADTYEVRLTATSYVTPNGDGSVIHTLVVGDARDPAANAPPVHCSSTGLLERRVAELVQ